MAGAAVANMAVAFQTSGEPPEGSVTCSCPQKPARKECAGNDVGRLQSGVFSHRGQCCVQKSRANSPGTTTRVVLAGESQVDHYKDQNLRSITREYKGLAQHVLAHEAWATNVDLPGKKNNVQREFAYNVDEERSSTLANLVFENGVYTIENDEENCQNTSISVQKGTLNSEVKTEKELLAKFRHVYAGKGGWFGKRSKSFCSNNNSDVNRTLQLNTKESIHNNSKEMPKTQYEQYKKEMVQKLSKSLQDQFIKEEKEKMFSRPLADMHNIDSEVNNQFNEDKMLNGVHDSQNEKNIIIPATWKLPIGWAGRNRGIFGNDRQKLKKNQPRDREWFQKGSLVNPSDISKTETSPTRKNDQNQHSKFSLVNLASPSHNTFANVGSGSTFNDRSQFTKSWLNTSYSYYRPDDGIENKNPNVKIGYFLQTPNPLKRESHSNGFVDPGLFNTNIDLQSKPQQTALTSPSGYDTARTGYTVQSFPSRAHPNNKHKKGKRLSLPSDERKNVPPLSSRKSMNMYSRMSLEAQAALKEMGLGQQKNPNQDFDSDSESMVEDGDKSERETSNSPKLMSNLLAFKKDNQKQVLKRGAIPHLRNNHVNNLARDSVLMGIDFNRINSYKSEILKQNAIESIRNEELNNDQVLTNKDEQKSLHSQHEQVNSEPCASDSESESNEDQARQMSLMKNNNNRLNQNNKSNTNPNNKVLNATPKSTPPRESIVADERGTLGNDQFKGHSKLPNIREISSPGSGGHGGKTDISTSTTPFFGTHRQIPGVGQYRLIQPGNKNSPLILRKENTFEITPVGYDSRFEDIKSKPENVDDTPEEVKLKAIEKCSDWIQKYL